VLDPLARALALLDAEAPKKQVQVQLDPADPRRRTYVVPTGDGRRQTVWAAPVPDALFRERLDLISLSVRELPVDARLLMNLLHSARELRRARICLLHPQQPQLGIVASFVAEEITDASGPRLLHALREVAAVADSIENLLTGGADVI
jgi:hypothetical protein